MNLILHSRTVGSWLTLIRQPRVRTRFLCQFNQIPARRALFVWIQLETASEQQAVKSMQIA